MTPGKQAVMRGNLRRLIGVYVQGCTVGKKLNTYTLARQFSNRRRFVTPHSISKFLYERMDLKRIGWNEWVVIRNSKLPGPE